MELLIYMNKTPACWLAGFVMIYNNEQVEIDVLPVN